MARNILTAHICMSACICQPEIFLQDKGSVKCTICNDIKGSEPYGDLAETKNVTLRIVQKRSPLLFNKTGKMSLISNSDFSVSAKPTSWQYLEA